MGYFSRAVRRSDARREKAALLDATREIHPADWSDCHADFRVPAESFVRFMIQLPGGRSVGLFRSSPLVNGSEELPPAAQSALSNAYRWFNRRLRFPRGMPQTAVCWFRADATEPIAMMRTLIETHRLVGYHVLMQATRTPGRIVYEDEHQVAAIPQRGRRPRQTAV